MLGLVAIYTTLGGVAAIIKPTFQFRSLLEVLLPHHLQSNAFVHAVTHPGLAQVQGVIGGPKGRPKAPFDYTNAWGESLTLLVPWLIVGWWSAGTRRRRILVAFVVGLAAVALLYSRNRTAWLGAALAVVYIVVRLVAKRPRALITVLCAGVLVVGVVAVATPVPSLIGKRLSTGGSAGIRTSLDGLAVRDALSSPVIGYGDSRKQLGSLQSVARGPTSDCPKCGQQEVGSTGQLWLLLICNGVVGAIVYVGFFAVSTWRFRRDRTPYGQAGVLVLLLSLLYLFSYEALSPPLGFMMLGYALLWRNELDRRRQPVQRQLNAWQERLVEPRVMTPELVA
jgi:O-antigen ligase